MIQYVYTYEESCLVGHLINRFINDQNNQLLGELLKFSMKESLTIAVPHKIDLKLNLRLMVLSYHAQLTIKRLNKYPYPKYGC